MSTAEASDPTSALRGLAPSREPCSYRGNAALLKRPATVFLCSTRCPGEKILQIYEWARRQCDEGGAVISGFHTPVEKDVLAILARRGANILWVPARDLPKTTPRLLQPAEEQGRLLILTPFEPGKPSRPTKNSCAIRNRFVLGIADTLFLPYVAEGSSLSKDILAIKHVAREHPDRLEANSPT